MGLVLKGLLVILGEQHDGTGYHFHGQVFPGLKPTVIYTYLLGFSKDNVEIEAQTSILNQQSYCSGWIY